MCTRGIAVVTLVFAALGCGDVQSDADASAGSDGAIGPDAPLADAAPPPDVDSCTPNQFIECANAETARYCNDSGDALEDLACGTPGCNDTEERCNSCVPNLASCNGNTLETCGADGLIATSDPCSRSCIAADGATPAHCEYLEPQFLADVCDTAATEPSLVISSSASFDTSLDTNCNGGIVSQSSSPALCVVRYGTFSINSGRTLTALGGRALAIVTDGDLEIAGVLDGGAANLTHGPGGGTIASGTISSNDNGSGGAGFHQAGRAGGSTVSGGGAAGGATLDPLALNRLIGGPRGPRSSIPVGGGASGGGGGGAITLISCRGTVRVTGTIDVGGGGGNGGGDSIAGGVLDLYGGGGGGAGGQVVFQGLDVAITGNLYANGGGGGGGGANDTVGGKGQDGTRSDSDSANGGIAQPGGGNGGTGGIGASNPGVGLARTNQTSSGGGGGSTGFFFVYVPSGVTPTLTPNQASPTLSSTQTANTR